ncbi:assimilatory nitrite reductase (NAD(P)H) small subunit [Knoellia remsis]|uniref:Assimilatory nitrite reductase (NAD(P)H) small subunit n=1 Tax=Knoellia remsis TaxID=407159 RepID=A0A2T0UZ36_9MICO|nr:nitrite reductase small subunit NirD [Knoellia remsis]PRY63193.1 assimilatory nitrite reductase (NAD(P)H) small subunit [Knoellia remsis]
MTVETGVVPHPDVRRRGFIAVCRVGDLVPERGAAALVSGEQVALFRCADDTVYAVQQLDPFSGAFVMARGIVGTRGEVPTVASPMYKQVFDLRTGECLDAVGKEPVPLAVWPVEVRDGVVHVAPPEGPSEVSSPGTET